MVLRNVYPFIVGANIGTTITALLAAIFKSPEAISIAVAHLMFNLIGGVIFLLMPIMNRLPIILADILGELCLKYRIISVIYNHHIFSPALCLYLYDKINTIVFKKCYF